MKFTTASGSTYEVDVDNKRVRRVSNNKNTQPTLRQGNDWRDYEYITDIVIGKPVMIFWNKSNTPLLEGSPEASTPATTTSLVSSLIN